MMEKKLAVLLALGALLVSGCGNKGDLYIPEDAPAPETSEQMTAPSAPEPAELVPADS